jgi:tripartite-type tricarboxylate transporter receptor subunit TctC
MRRSGRSTFRAATLVTAALTAHAKLGTLIQTIPHFKGGRIRALAASGGKRALPTPKLPTIAEAGIPGYEANNGWAIGAPAGTPAAIITKLNTEIARYLKLPETAKRFEAEGVEADIRTPEEVRKMLPVEMAKWANVAKVANIRTQ